MSDEQDGTTMWEAGQSGAAPQPNEPAIEYVSKAPDSSIYAVIAAALGMAVLFAVCFTGEGVLPCVSATLFACAAMAAIVFLLKKMGLEKEKKGYAWFIPAAIVAAMNGIFSINAMNYTNIIVISLLITRAASCVAGGAHKPFSLNFMSEAFGYMASLATGAFPFVKAAFAAIAGGKGKKLAKVLFSVLAAAPILIIVAALLMSADPVFAYFMGQFFSGAPRFDFGQIATVAAMFAAFGGYARHMAAGRGGENIGAPAVMLEQVATSTFLILLNLLFFLFCTVQALFLFTGGFMKLPNGMVYSEYAREGFFQLLFVTVINFAALFAFLTIINGGRVGGLTKRLLVMLGVFTGVLIASSFYRMTLYISVYHYTPLRMQVITFLAMESALLAITLAVLLCGRQRGRFDFIHASGMVCLLFYIIVNITGSGYCSDYLNFKAYKAENSIGVDLRSFSPDGYGLMLGLSDQVDLRGQVKMRLEHRALDKRAYGAGPKWQNWNLLQALSDRAIERSR